MYYCCDFYSLSVVSLYEGELLGKVDKLCFDKKLKKLIEIELISEQGVRLILPTKNIYRIGKNAITIKNNQAVSLKNQDTNLCLVPINSKAYSINGEFLGVVKDLTINEKFLTQKIHLENSALEVKDVASCGKNTVIFYNKDNRVNVKNFMPEKQPKLFKSEAVQVAKILPKENTNVVPVEVKAQPLFQDANFLIGRVCTKDIFNFNNELLIKAHGIVNKKNLKEINRFGKLRELMLYVK